MCLLSADARKIPMGCGCARSAGTSKCSLDGKLISVRNGAIQLGQHEKQKIHIDAAAALPRQPSIRNSLVSAVDDDSGRLRATFYHVVRIALDGGSFRSSDCVSRKRSLYSVMFPDSRFAKICCGRTKARYLTYIMTDNCSVMRGKLSGYITKITEIAPNMLSLSPIVRRCYIIYETQSSDKYIRVLGNLCKYVHCNGVKALDELASVRLEHTTEASLDAMFTQSLLSTSPT